MPEGSPKAITIPLDPKTLVQLGIVIVLIGNMFATWRISSSATSTEEKQELHEKVLQNQSRALQLLLNAVPLNQQQIPGGMKVETPKPNYPKPRSKDEGDNEETLLREDQGTLSGGDNTDSS